MFKMADVAMVIKKCKNGDSSVTAENIFIRFHKNNS
jgi:hypothetical protein